MPVTVSRRELTWVLVWAALIMALTCLPYVYAIHIAEGRTCSGFLWGVDEGNVYLAWMRQAAEGEWFLRNQYCVAPENPRFVNLFFQLGGRLCALTGLSEAVVFHVLRVAGGAFLLWSLYLLVATITRDKVVRWTTLVLASLGSGLGWLVVLNDGVGGLRPVDVGLQWQIQPEAVTFPSLLLNGLFVTAMGLMCQCLRLAVRAVAEDRTRAAVGAGVMLLILGNVHTYNVFAVHLALVVWLGLAIWRGAVEWHTAARHYSMIFLLGMPSLAWAFYAAKADPAFMAKGLTPTQAFRFVDYAVGYGLVGLLAVAGAVVAWRCWVAAPRSGALPGQIGAADSALGLPVCWALANTVVLFTPVSFQRKMIEGLHLPLCMLAGLAVAALAGRLTRGSRMRGRRREAAERTVLTIVAVAALCLPSNALFVAQCLGQVRNNNANLAHVLQPPLFLEAGDAAAVEWLGSNSSRDDVVIASSFIGSFVPTRGPARPWVGHWAETLALTEGGRYLSPSAPLESWRRLGHGVQLARFGDNLRYLPALYRPASGLDPLQLLRQTPVTMVYYGTWERSLTAQGADRAEEAVAAWKADVARALQVVYDAAGVTIYRVPDLPGAPR